MVNNPWSPEFWNVTAQGAYVRQYGVAVASRTAKLAGVTLGAVHPKTDEASVLVKQYVMIKKIGNTGGSGGGGGGGLIGAGSSGNGPPT